MSVFDGNLFSLMEKALAEIKEREARLVQESEWVTNSQLKTEKSVKLNVGGILYSTSVSTLQSDSKSMLAAMFSGRFGLEKDEAGAYFIDRNGQVFKHVLEFLRTGKVCPFLTDQDLFWLKEEAQFYQLSGLIKLLEADVKPQNCIYLVAQQRDYFDGITFDAWIQQNLIPKVQEGYHVVPVGTVNMNQLSSVPKRFLLYK